MLLSLILAWIAVLCAGMTALKFLARISKNRALNRSFSKWHIQFGVLMFVTGLLHGILAGNSSRATLSDVQIAPLLFRWNWGTICFLLTAALATTYLLRKRLKKHWMPAHRVLTVALLACLALHIGSMGIQLPDRVAALAPAGSASALEQTDVSTPAATVPEDADESAQADTSAGQEPAAGNQADSSESTDAAGTSDLSDSGSMVTFSGAQLKDGTYQGSAQGYRSAITVSVTVSGGQVSDISVVNENDTSQYFNRAEGILDAVLSEQSLEVDTVSGATFSSAGILNAVADALQNAVVSGTLQVTNIDLTAVRRH